jgi:hypothetical protein
MTSVRIINQFTAYLRILKQYFKNSYLYKILCYIFVNNIFSLLRTIFKEDFPFVTVVKIYYFHCHRVKTQLQIINITIILLNVL